MVCSRLFVHLALLVLLTWPGAAASNASAPIATYRHGEVSHEVSQAEYESWLRFKKAQDEPPKRVSQLEELALVRVAAEQAGQRGLDKQPRVRFFLQHMQQTILHAAWRKRETNSLSVSEEEVEAAYRNDPNAFQRPRKVRLLNLYKRFPAQASPAQRTAIQTKMKEIRRQLLAGADFRDLARRESDSQTRFEGGVVGLVVAGQLRPEFDAVVMHLKPNQISEIIETPDGLTIFQCDYIQPADKPSAAEVRKKLYSVLLQSKRKQHWKDVQQTLLKDANPTYFTDQLASAAAESVVLRFASHTLTFEELGYFLQLRQIKSRPHELKPERLKTVLNAYIRQVRAAEQARARGLAGETEIRDRLKWKRLELLFGEELRQRIVERFVPLTQEEIRTYFNTNRDTFRHPPAFDLAVIQLQLDQNSRRAQYERAQQLSLQLSSGQLDFAQAAQTHSVHPSAPKGGRLGWLDRRRLTAFGPRVYKTVTAMQPGTTSQLIEQDSSVWIVKLLAARAERPMTFAEAAPQAENRLGNARIGALQRQIKREMAEALQLRLATKASTQP